MDCYKKEKVLKIVGYYEHYDCHICIDEEANQKILIDIMVDGSIDIPKDADFIDQRKSLIGRRVKINHSHAHVQIAYKPTILEVE